MNKIFTFLNILYLIPAFCEAQFLKNQKLIGGYISFSTNSGNSTGNVFDNRNVYHISNTGIGINPSIAKFINPKRLVGLGIVYNYSRYFTEEEMPDNGNKYEDKQQSGGVNIFSQQFIPLINNFFLTVHAGGIVLYN